MSEIVTVRRLPYVPPKYERGEMSLEQKKEFYAMPLQLQLYYRQFGPALGEPQVKKPGDDDDYDHFWFSKPLCELIPNEKLVRLPTERYGGDLGFFGEKSDDELREWEDYLASLAPETRSYIESIINQVI
ncbi:hypothetical protein CTI12_AA613650 [Artemisia annua]|uniref:Uncharacterized protein n=1 Tax=Artemisia annua TaxID=35608 RepID=A0A2U1KDZ6_ARTAN|nr:hypothetical protein CTI12_AA613650 [Artemisia annua]